LCIRPGAASFIISSIAGSTLGGQQLVGGGAVKWRSNRYRADQQSAQQRAADIAGSSRVELFQRAAISGGRENESSFDGAGC
jgi:hypothetical protein